MRRQTHLNVKNDIYLCQFLRHYVVYLVTGKESKLCPMKQFIETGSERKGVEQSEMFNYSVYSRLGNNF